FGIRQAFSPALHIGPVDTFCRSLSHGLSRLESTTLAVRFLASYQPLARHRFASPFQARLSDKADATGLDLLFDPTALIAPSVAFPSFPRKPADFHVPAFLRAFSEH